MATLNHNIELLAPLNSTSPFNLSLAILLLLGISYILQITYFSPLARIKGPFWASFSRLWLAKHSFDGDMHRVIIDAHAKYGTLVRTGPSEVSVADISAIKKMYGAGTKFRKSKWYSVWQGRRKFDIFPESDERIHADQRRLVSHIYAMNNVVKHQDKVDEAIQVFVEKLVELGSEKPVDCGSWVQWFAFDVIGAVTFSKRFGFLDAGSDGGQLQVLERALRSGAWVGQMPWVYWLNDYLTPLIGNHLDVNSRHGSVRQFTTNQINDRMRRDNEKSEEKDLLTQLFDVHKAKPKEMDDIAVISMATSNVFGGSDSTATSIRAIIWYLLKNPRCKQALLDEIDDRKQKKSISYPVQMEEATQMPYLQACMYEALRLHPAVGMSLPRVVPSGGIEIDGHFLPAGTTVGVNPWVLHRNKSIFGDDVETYRPERWLVENKGDMERYFFAFGNGARACLGRNISWMEMSKLIPSLFLKFEISLADSSAEWRESCWWFVRQDNVFLNFVPKDEPIL